MSLLQTFLDYLKHERRYSAHTLAAYQSDLEQFDVWARAQLELDILHNPADVQKLNTRIVRSWIADTPQSKATLSRKLSALKSYLKFLNKHHGLEAPTNLKINLPKKTKRIPTVVPLPELQQLLDAPSQPENDSNEFRQLLDHCIMELLYGCGLRRSEVVGLRYAEVDLNRKTLRVLGKGNKLREVPFGTTLQTALRRYQEACMQAGLATRETFLVLPTGKPLNVQYVYRLVRRELEQVPDLTRRSPHILRHSYATHLMNNGADLNAVKELLGHKNLTATQVYVRSSIQKLQSTHNAAHPKGKEDS